MVSVAPVRVARAPVDVDTANVMCLLETFSYSTDCDRVEFWLPLEFISDSRYKNYFVTLCAVTNSTKLQALGSSVPWSELNVNVKLGLDARSSEAPFHGWTSYNGMAQRALLTDGLFLDGGIELEELTAKILTNGKGAWKIHAVLETSRNVIVQLLLPRPLPGPGKLTISVTGSGSSLKVATNAVSRSTWRRDVVFQD